MTETAVMSRSAILDGSEVPERRTLKIAGGMAIAYSCREPLKETSNEDTVAVVPYGPAAAVFIVADGAGGLPAGKRASLTAVETLVRALQSAEEKTSQLRTAVMNGIESANNAVMALGNGSATTLTVLTLEERLARSYQIGDSEALVVGQRGAVRLQTTAHSPTGFAVEAGFLDQRDALHHAERHLVSNFVGTPEMTIDVGALVRTRVLDTVLLASDGLLDNVHVDEIIDIVQSGPLDTAVDKLLALATRRMTAIYAGEPSKPDDLSLILFRRNKAKSNK